MNTNMTAEDLAALGHFTRRWTIRRGRTMRHATMIANPENIDARAMAARDVTAEWAFREDGTVRKPADWVRDELADDVTTREMIEHLCGEPLL